MPMGQTMQSPGMNGKELYANNLNHLYTVPYELFRNSLGFKNTDMIF